MFKFLGEKLQRVSSITLNSQPDISSVSATFLPISYAYAYSYPYAYSYTYCMFGSSQFRGYGLPLNWNGLTLLIFIGDTTMDVVLARSASAACDSGQSCLWQAACALSAGSRRPYHLNWSESTSHRTCISFAKHIFHRGSYRTFSHSLLKDRNGLLKALFSSDFWDNG